MDYRTTDTEITSIADAIRSKGGTSGQLVYPDGFVSAIGAISTATLGTKTVYDAGTYAASTDNLDGYSSVTVSIADGDNVAY